MSPNPTGSVIPEKKPVWHYSEIPIDAEAAAMMPGMEIQYMITEDTVVGDSQTVFGHCVFPPRVRHSKHLHLKAEEVVYVVRGRVVNGFTNEKGEDIEVECGPGQACFAKRGQIHWTANPFDEPVEVVFGYFGCSSLAKSGYVDLRTPEEKGNGG
ncbi:MAG: cupin domain-containing protein [Chloroflexi bacterium]|nr:cupin domain-containing protein [Chloroflexota bacterium]